MMLKKGKHLENTSSENSQCPAFVYGELRTMTAWVKERGTPSNRRRWNELRNIAYGNYGLGLLIYLHQSNPNNNNHKSEPRIEKTTTIYRGGKTPKCIIF